MSRSLSLLREGLAEAPTAATSVAMAVFAALPDNGANESAICVADGDGVVPGREYAPQHTHPAHLTSRAH